MTFHAFQLAPRTGLGGIFVGWALGEHEQHPRRVIKADTLQLAGSAFAALTCRERMFTRTPPVPNAEAGTPRTGRDCRSSSRLSRKWSEKA
jgi:hypothetical protein